MKKRILTLIIGVVLMLALTACGQKSSEAPAATEAPTATTAPAVNEDITETVEPTVAPTEAPVIEEPTDVEEVVPTEAPVIEEPVVEPTDVPKIEEPVPTEAPVVVEPTDVPEIEEPVVEPAEETTPDTNQNTDSETNEDAYHNNSFTLQTGKAQDTEFTVITKEEADALRKAEEERRAKIKSFPLEVTYMHDSKANRAMGKAPELRTRTFNTFMSEDGTDTDLYSALCTYNNTDMTYSDVKVLIEAIDPAYVSYDYNQDLELTGLTENELMTIANNVITTINVDGTDVNVKPTGEYYVSFVTELSTDMLFIWGVRFVVEDTDNPGTTLYVDYLTHEFIDTFLMY